MKKTKYNDMIGSVRNKIVEHQKNLPETEPNSDPYS